MVHLGGAPRKQRKWGGQGGKEVSTGSVNEQVIMVGAWGSVLRGTSGRWCGTRHTGGPPEGQRSCIYYWLRAALRAIHSNPHLEPGKKKASVRGLWDLAEHGADCWASHMGRAPQHLLQGKGQSCPQSVPLVAEEAGNFHSKNSHQGMSPNIKICCSIYPGE